MARLIIITCTAPGFRRAGRVHPAKAEYLEGFWTDEQLEELRSEPKLRVIVTEIPGGGEAEGTPSGAPVAPASTQLAEAEAMAAAPEGEGEQPGASEQREEGATGASSISSGDDPGQDEGQPATDAAPARGAAKKKPA